MSRNNMQTRMFATRMKARAEPEGDMILEADFAVFGKETELFPGGYEEIEHGAFSECLQDDIRALINHDTTLVLGRTKSGTLSLEETSEALHGKIIINPNDSDAVNLYERVKRGDVDQCSFGFDILEEDTEWREDGTVKWTIKKVKLYEVSPVTFPAYEDTAVQARGKEVEKRKHEVLKQRKNKLKERFENGIKGIGLK